MTNVWMISGVVLLFLASMADASLIGDVIGQVGGSILGVVGDIIEYVSGILLTTAAGGVITIGIIIALQYLGIDVIGITFDILFTIFDILFSLARFAMASEGNIVAMILVFLFLWLIMLTL